MTVPSVISCKPLPFFSSSGLPCSPAEAYLRFQCPFPSRSSNFSSLLLQRQKKLLPHHGKGKRLTKESDESERDGNDAKDAIGKKRREGSRHGSSKGHPESDADDASEGGLEEEKKKEEKNRNHTTEEETPREKTKDVDILSELLEDGKQTAQEASTIHYGRWCVIHEDLIPYAVHPFVYIADGVVLRPPPFLAVTRSEGVMISPFAAESTSSASRSPSTLLPPSPHRRRSSASSSLSSPSTATVAVGSSSGNAAQETGLHVGNTTFPTSPLWSVSIPVGSYTFIGPRVVCEASKIESFVFIAEEAVIGPLVEIMEGACVTAGSVVPGETVLAPYTVYDGRPVIPRGTMNATAHQQVQRELLRRLMS